ncbi:SMI1/KNR4 family protein [Streptomyces sp. NPDC087440]|uniref:SMI1/KNR4 family protein n=1 Tax=Streptomyces sp. NPDC087440 TaxID=3365790 RepID=UPI0037FD4557
MTMTDARDSGWQKAGELTCGRPGHGKGHLCLSGPRDAAELDAEAGELSDWFGEAFVGVRGLPGTLGGEPVAWGRVWASGARWLAVGRVGGGSVLVALERTTPDPDALPESATWLERLVAVTGWEAVGRPPTEVDWADVERRLGTRLPGDYKRLYETFGEGDFDGFLGVYGPEYLISTAVTARYYDEERTRFPAPGGRLTWGGNEHEQDFHWIPDADTDPDRWPVHVADEGATDDEVERFDCTLTEAVYRYLTDLRFPGSMAEHFDVHWFQATRAE